MICEQNTVILMYVTIKIESMNERDKVTLKAT
jgi:hypothetical protein